MVLDLPCVARDKTNKEKTIARKKKKKKKELMDNHFMHVFSSIWEIPLFLLS